MVLILALVTMAIAIGVGDGPTAGTPHAASSPSPKEPDCSEPRTREECRDIVVDGRVWRYSLTRPETPTEATVLVDFGGPGLAALSGELNLVKFRQTYSQLANRFNLLVIEEPWVTRHVPEKCGSALSGFYRAVRDRAAEIQKTADGLQGACALWQDSPLWGFNPGAYSALIGAIAAKDGLVLSGFLGFSWGATRLAYLPPQELDFTVLVRPFPVGVDAGKLLRGRNSVNKALGRSISWKLNPTRIQGRSIPVTQVDAFSAEIALAYLDQQDVAEKTNQVHVKRNVTAIGELSDSLWGRYGRRSLAPSILAQMEETCNVVGQLKWDVVRNDSVSAVLSASFAPCKGQARTNLQPTISGRGCIVSSPVDAVTPERLIRGVYGKFTDVRWIGSRDSSHRSLDGVSKCLELAIAKD